MSLNLRELVVKNWIFCVLRGKYKAPNRIQFIEEASVLRKRFISHFRYKKARSFCNLEENQPPEASTSEKRLSEVGSVLVSLRLLIIF